MNITKNLKYFFILPALLSIAAIIALTLWGLKPGIDLSGGSLLQVSYLGDRPTVEQIHTTIAPLAFGEVRVQPTGDSGFILRQRDLSNEEHTAFLKALGGFGAVTEEQFTSVGPSLGAELLRKAWVAIALVVVLTILFIAFAFRGVSKPIASWKYGIVAIATLLHDILIPAGLFALLGHFAGAEVDALFIVALLTILGISINDTIVVFDRIRENLRLNEEHRKREEFEEVIGRSIMQTLARSINTSMTVIIVLVALYFLGPIATKNFALTLIVGMVAGTYSSIFLASPLLVVWEKWSRKGVK
ncbi:protein-export membrane protein SecF [Candidatus Adlerbacteria bacterium RIFCSPLOWO2_01_FULL_51_16]|uniref:Protein-export membrane protein SecF n=1 Tax=Candidatus Adlerbacteria bacterium RIFCSPLOWO2_01_FULL_51_16 TaxID=1797243 RepID=A0A1F4XGW0_9BACT|nr:MAG: protein-export membrane protein SecF [Candidatus Adlerbacteria bacterium RIFCSPLOWO2_01_FULL_51_16]